MQLSESHTACWDPEPGRSELVFGQTERSLRQVEEWQTVRSGPQAQYLAGIVRADLQESVRLYHGRNLC